MVVVAKAYTSLMKEPHTMKTRVHSERNLQSVMTACTTPFFDRFIMDKMDKNPQLCAFANGIYDFERNIFRDGTPDDFISRQAAATYDEALTLESPSVQVLLSYLTQVFPTPAVRRYFMDIYCDVFIGHNVNSYIMLWTAAGANGKSVLQKLFLRMLGPLGVTLPTSVILGKRGHAGSATPELSVLDGGVRLAFIQEPKGDDIVNAGVLKELSGGDNLYIRGLYKEAQVLTPMFDLTLVCNEPPKIPDADDAYGEE